ncbi:MAG: aldehyde dehydrogenase family protein [Synechococcaceae cyanobacterium]|nr:aldehyde dehydrogenase family protein [Synechococcaceae cyanobacterium]
MVATSPPLLLNPTVEAMRALVHGGATADLPWRLEQLTRLERLLVQARAALPAALAADMGRPEAEGLFELAGLRDELQLTRRNLARWMAPRPVKMPFWALPGQAQVQAQPLGCVLILAPWNYPFQLCMQPLVSALAAGNSVVLKPSEQAPATAALVARLIREQFPPDIVQVVEGDGAVAAALLDQHFDHILYTGNGRIGRQVMAAADRHLTPVTLELGGACPAIVLAEAEIATTARRLAWGKSVNAGQTCVAPNHVLVLDSQRQQLSEALIAALRHFHGDAPLASPDLGGIINDRQFARLETLLQQARQRGQILHGGRSDAASRKIEPTLIAAQGPQDPLLSEEIFGPILPILGVPDLETALGLVQSQPPPLTIYLFGADGRTRQRVQRSSRSGSLVCNDVIVQAGITSLPFGGVGESGMGAYHGWTGFQAFSANRSLLERPFRLDLPFRYPPYAGKLPLIRRLFAS